MSKITLGGERLGAGKKMQVETKTYNRSTHDLGYLWRSTMSAGTLVPFMSELALPGDTWDIKLNTDIKTHPTEGPLFGSYKVQLDVFVAPIRLYQAQLHNNALGIGMNMAKIKLPQVELWAKAQLDPLKSPDNQQINPSCIFSYLNIRGLGQGAAGDIEIQRKFNAIPWIAYWDIYKNYYANKQEEKGAVVHTQREEINKSIINIIIHIETETGGYDNQIPVAPAAGLTPVSLNSKCVVNVTAGQPLPEPSNIYVYANPQERYVPLTDIYQDWTEKIGQLIGTNVKVSPQNTQGYDLYNWRYIEPGDVNIIPPRVVTFPLDNIDKMRERILMNVQNPDAFVISYDESAPYGLVLGGSTVPNSASRLANMLNSQEGLGIKTYQSDLFNNWLNTEYLIGDNGISAITRVDTSKGYFEMDSLRLANKVYDMMLNIAVSGGTYDDWISANWSNGAKRRATSPMYMGGLIKELVFQEVISNASSAGQPLGQLAGKGVLGKKHKGGDVTIKVDEPSYIIGIVSLTPRLDYSQGNKWDMNLKTMDDIHKPALDEIGFQDLITDQMAWWDTRVDANNVVTFRSAGKQPAWINYQTNVNQTRGNFAIEDNEMFMTLNRRYERSVLNGQIKDLTSYIDPSKFNNIFAETSLDAQNFWTQISIDAEVRRVMSARIMPNL